MVVLLEVTKAAEIDAPAAVAWALLRDVPRLSGCVPNVGQVEEVVADRRYSAVVADRLGPFRLELPIQIELTTVDEPRELVADLRGNDSRGQARVQGTLRATVAPAGQGDRSALTLAVRLEVLGRLASLGAAPMRRRADEIFSEFLERVRAELESSTCSNRVGPGEGE